MKHYLIYQIQNKLNGMIYIGQHITDNINDDYMGSGIWIKRAIAKYGVENFEKTILFECSSKDEMNKKEAEIVNKDFIAREDVYNIKLGGEGGWDEINRQHKNIGFQYANQYHLNNKCGQCYIAANRIKSDPAYAEEFANKIKAGQARARAEHPEKFDMHGEKNPMFGRKHSIETLKKLSEAHRGSRNVMSHRMWIKNPQTLESKTWPKDSSIPEGWERGRYQFKEKA